jgi:hypothetical protein
MTALNLLEFERLLEDRRGHCARLLELSRRQRDLIAGGEYTALLGVLGQKQQILGRLGRQQHTQPALVEFWRSRRDALPPDDRRRCEQLLAELDDVLARLVGEEQSSRESLARQRDATRGELEQLNQGADVHRAYRDGTAAATHRHLDLGG